jgi:hypothetical protein
MQAAAKWIEDEDFIGNPPTCEENERAHRVQIICDLLAQAERGDETTAWALSSALDSIDARSRNPARIPITAGQREKLLMAVVRAHVTATEYLAPWFNQQQINRGMKALAGQVMLWAETGERSMLRGYGRVADVHAYARIFRNHMHNLSLAEEIAMRAHERRERCIQDLFVNAHKAEARRA